MLIKYVFIMQYNIYVNFMNATNNFQYTILTVEFYPIIIYLTETIKEILGSIVCIMNHDFPLRLAYWDFNQNLFLSIIIILYDLYLIIISIQILYSIKSIQNVCSIIIKGTIHDPSFKVQLSFKCMSWYNNYR